jgi:hypothetical protein
MTTRLASSQCEFLGHTHLATARLSVGHIFTIVLFALQTEILINSRCLVYAVMQVQSQSTCLPAENVE